MHAEDCLIWHSLENAGRLLTEEENKTKPQQFQPRKGASALKTSWTVDDVVPLWARIYDRKRIEELWAGRKSLDFRQIAELDVLFVERLRLLITSKAVESIMERAILKHALHCGVDSVEQWAELWLSGADRSADKAHLAQMRATTRAAATVAHAATAAATATDVKAWLKVGSLAVAAAERAWVPDLTGVAPAADAAAASAREAERELQLADCIAVFEASLQNS